MSIFTHPYSNTLCDSHNHIHKLYCLYNMSEALDRDGRLYVFDTIFVYKRIDFYSTCVAF